MGAAKIGGGNVGHTTEKRQCSGFDNALFCFYFQLEDNCFTMLCCFLGTTWVSLKYTCPTLLKLTPSPFYPSRMSQSTSWSSPYYTTASHWLSSLHMVMYVSRLLSQFFPPSPSPAVSKSSFSTSASLFLPCKKVDQYHFS